MALDLQGQAVNVDYALGLKREISYETLKKEVVLNCQHTEEEYREKLELYGLMLYIIHDGLLGKNVQFGESEEKKS